MSVRELMVMLAVAGGGCVLVNEEKEEQAQEALENSVLLANGEVRSGRQCVKVNRCDGGRGSAWSERRCSH